MTRPHRFVYDSFLVPASASNLNEEDQDSIKAGFQQRFTSFLEGTVDRKIATQNSFGVKLDFNNDLTEVESARLEQAMQKSLNPVRQQSHFVELNSNNEDMLLEDIEDTEKHLNKMLLDDDKDADRNNRGDLKDIDEMLI